MSSAQFLASFEELREAFIAVRDRPLEANDIADYAEVDTMFQAMVADPACGDGDAVAANTERAAQQLVLARGELEIERDRLREDLAAVEAEAQRRLAGDDEVPDVSAELVAVHDVRGFQVYCAQAVELAGGLATARTVFNGLLAKSAEDIREERASATDLRFAEPAAWAARREQLSRLLDGAAVKAAALALPPPDQSAALLAEVDRLATDAAAHVAAAAAQRRRRDDRLKVFYGECDKLTLWCRQQLANLDAMQQPDHIQEYCRTLAGNYAAMSANFSVLVEGVVPFVAANHAPARRALLEADQVWFHVMVAALERLSRTLFEIHPESLLEDEVDKYTLYPKHLSTTLATVVAFLEQERDRSEEAEAILAECGRLAADVKARQAATAQGLKAFAARSRASRVAYDCFRESILSRLTYAASTPADVVAESRRRQGEFEECVTELKTWAVRQAHGESWRDIYSKIVEIKRTIQREQQYMEERSGGN